MKKHSKALVFFAVSKEIPIVYSADRGRAEIIAEPKYKYGQQEQVTVRNHNRSTALERPVLKYWEA